MILGILRYMQITLVENRSGSPTEVLLRDGFLQLAILGWLATFAVLIYRVNTHAECPLCRDNNTAFGRF